jgi:hypothetical protein
LNGLHGVIFGKIELFVITDVRTSDPTNCIGTFEVMRLCIKKFKKNEKNRELKEGHK